MCSRNDASCFIKILLTYGRFIYSKIELSDYYNYYYVIFNIELSHVFISSLRKSVSSIQELFREWRTAVTAQTPTSLKSSRQDHG